MSSQIPKSDLFPILISHLGLSLVRGSNLEPIPADKSIALIYILEFMIQIVLLDQFKEISYF